MKKYLLKNIGVERSYKLMKEDLFDKDKKELFESKYYQNMNLIKKLRFRLRLN